VFNYPEKQEFKNSVEVLENSIYTLHYFPMAKSQPTTSNEPVFIIPPHAGRHPSIAQNMIDKCVSEGRHTYAFELKPATARTANTGIGHLIIALCMCSEKITDRHDGHKIGYIGLCQGAWLSAIYLSMFVHNANASFYCNFAGPINTKTGQENIIEKYCRNVDIDIHRTVVNLNGGLQLGIYQWLSFAMVDPRYVFVDRWTDLYSFTMQALFSFNGISKLKKWFKNNSWYDTSQDIAGTWFLDCLENHFIENKLYNGTWNVGYATPNLKDIKCPVYLYAGDEDEITHFQQVFDMEKVVGSTEVQKTLFAGAGHTKVFVGKDELEYFAKEVLRK